MPAVYLADLDTQVVIVVVEDGAKTVLRELASASSDSEGAVLKGIPASRNVIVILTVISSLGPGVGDGVCVVRSAQFEFVLVVVIP